jgi:hypothetical protein
MLSTHHHHIYPDPPMNTEHRPSGPDQEVRKRDRDKKRHIRGERVTKETNAGRGVDSSQGHDRIGEQHARKRALKSKCKSYGRHADAQLRVYHEPLGRPPHGAHNGSKSIMTTGDRTADASTRLCNLENKTRNNYYYRYARSEKGGIAKLYGTARFISSSGWSQPPPSRGLACH